MANEKLITTAALIAKFQHALDEGWGYIWGTAGETWTEAKQKELEKTTDADREKGRKYGSKWIGKRVTDCSGLFSWAFGQLGGTMYHGSNTMFLKWCTAKGALKNGKRIDGKELLPGTAVFTYNPDNKKRGHVGLYIGGGWVIEAQGTLAGVVRSKITLSKWVEWGELKGVDYGYAAQSEPAAADSNVGYPVNSIWHPTIRQGSKGDIVKECQRMLNKLGYNLGICGIDGDFGTSTLKAVKAFQQDHQLIADGVVGPMTWDALEKAAGDVKTETPASTKTYKVVISGLDLTQAKAIAATYSGQSEIIEGSDGK